MPNLEQCRTCGHPIASTAKRCPGCGADVGEIWNMAALATALIVAWILAGAASLTFTHLLVSLPFALVGIPVGASILHHRATRQPRRRP
jgi:hypothetical protein